MRGLWEVRYLKRYSFDVRIWAAASALPEMNNKLSRQLGATTALPALQVHIGAEIKSLNLRQG